MESYNCGKTTLLLNLLLKPNWLDYNHLYVFGNTLHQKEYQVMKKALDLGLTKQQINNIFKNQEEFEKIKASPLEVIEDYNGYRKSEIKVAFGFPALSLMGWANLPAIPDRYKTSKSCSPPA